MSEEPKKYMLPVGAFICLSLVYLSPIILFNFMSSLVGLFTFREYARIARQPVSLIYFFIVLALSVNAGFLYNKVYNNYKNGKISLEKTNKTLKKYAMLNIVIPILAGLFQGNVASFIIMIHPELQPASFLGESPLISIVLFSLGCVFDFALLFYVLYTRLLEPKLADIPFKKNEISLSLVQRNLLTLVFALLGTIFLLLVEVTIPANLEAGRSALIRKMIPIAAYAVVFFIVIELCLIGDIKNSINEINYLAENLYNKNYTVEDQPAGNRSELGVIVQNINNLKNQITGILKEIGHSTQENVRQSTDLAANMSTTKDNVANISSAISSVQSEIENQSAGVEESNSSIEQIIGNIRALNSAIESQASGVTQSSAAVEEMVANIRSVTQILDKNSESVKMLNDAAETGQRQVQTAVETATDVLKQSEGIIVASKTIQSIASRTNLLAMNAAIESAHAGEAGKGFAVVADEIRKLAEQSSVQSKNIDENLHSLSDAIGRITQDISAVQTAFGNIYEISQTIQSQEDVISNAMDEQNAGNQQVLEAMRDITNSTTEVRNGSSEMLVGGEQILKEMANLSEVTRNISESMNQITSYSQQISDAVTVTTASTASTQAGLQSLMAELSEFKMN